MNELHYKGDVTAGALDVDRPMGPDRYGAWYAPQSAWYDQDLDRTTIKFSGGTYQDMMNLIDPPEDSE